MNKSVLIKVKDGGEFSAYAAYPRSGNGPALILLQYIFGVNKVMRDLADDYAAQGYFVIVPDLFWRQEPNVRLADDPSKATPEEQKKAMALNDGFDDVLALSDLAAVREFAGADPACSGKVGVLGFCLGGRMSYRMAAHVPVDCAVSYYGVNLEKHLAEGRQIACPTLMHMAGQDFLVPEQTRKSICDALAGNKNIDIEIYPGVNHAFALAGGANYSRGAAELANRRSDEFLRKYLQLAA